MSNDFYNSRAWIELRYRVLRKHGFKCGACGLTASDGVKIHVDHIKPRSRYPDLELHEENLQVLCESCNLGKSNYFEDSFVISPTVAEEKEKQRLTVLLENLDVLAIKVNIDGDEKQKVKRDIERRILTLAFKQKSRAIADCLRGKSHDYQVEILSQLMNAPRLTNGASR